MDSQGYKELLKMVIGAAIVIGLVIMGLAWLVSSKISNQTEQFETNVKLEPTRIEIRVINGVATDTIYTYKIIKK
jgi:hypothetical protein